ncbi:AER055Wp [Eremothecium gossypii ATCC 10895]|uniref:AER055Wp n=1 Tax=Eremothecium gossypii (strain ATCC 10895 / CBS 109.51 / FGSC 9923 / NRRL Y-1056) TaxID=284811 RepID=Q757F8_EREGS|nr:AER055Wp [Eremothecium gossypii ATCC 10895]AAS52739.1 AER055Wp [Eremothecium gossypii ATCC 10895]AEY97045.1 FAER055Wp [Eremothecium gossypii FDAG1]
MAKSRKKLRSNKARVNPILRDAAKDAQVRSKRIQPLMQQLQSAAVNDRQMALGSISVLCEDAHMRELFLREKLLQEVMSRLLTDDNTEIVVEAYGLLRNLCLEQGYDVAIYMWRSDIWVSISAGLEKLVESLSSLSSNAKASIESRRLLFDFGDNLISLVVALADGASEIQEQLVAEHLPQLFHVITQILKYGFIVGDDSKTCTLKITTQLFNSVLDLIYDFASDSAAFMDALHGHPDLSQFVQTLPELNILNGSELTQVLVQGILLQLLDESITFQQAESILDRTCAAIQPIDLALMKHTLNTAEQEKELSSLKNTEEFSSMIRKQSDNTKKAMMQMQSLELSLEIVTAVTELLASQVEQRREPLPGTLVNILKQVLPDFFNVLAEDFTSHVLMAWNNLLWLFLSLEINVFELANEPWKQLWSCIYQAGNVDPRVRFGKLSCVWALLKAVQLQANPTEYLDLLQVATVDFVQSIRREYDNAGDAGPEDQLDLRLRCCHVLFVLATFQQHIDVNREVGLFFLHILSQKDTHPQLLVEVADHFIDIYSDAAFDYDHPNFVGLGFLDTLRKDIVPNLRAAFKFVDKNKDPQLKAECHELFTTLGSFVAYKEGERS